MMLPNPSSQRLIINDDDVIFCCKKDLQHILEMNFKTFFYIVPRYLTIIMVFYLHVITKSLSDSFVVINASLFYFSLYFLDVIFFLLLYFHVSIR